MGIPDHLTCLLRNLYVGQEAIARTGYGTTDCFKIERGVRQGCILSPCLFIFCAELLKLLSCVRLWDSMNCSIPGFPVLHHLPEFAQTHVHWVRDAILPSHHLSHSVWHGVARVEISTLLLVPPKDGVLSASQDVISPGPEMRTHLQPESCPLLIYLSNLNFRFLFWYLFDLRLLV